MDKHRSNAWRQTMDGVHQDDWVRGGLASTIRGTSEMGVRPSVPMSIANRLKEIICVMTAHDWNEYGRTTGDNGWVLEEYSKCDRCGLENHDRSGYLNQ